MPAESLLVLAVQSLIFLPYVKPGLLCVAHKVFGTGLSCQYLLLQPVPTSLLQSPAARMAYTVRFFVALLVPYSCLEWDISSLGKILLPLVNEPPNLSDHFLSAGGPITSSLQDVQHSCGARLWKLGRLGSHPDSVTC